jgi:solute carrier family 25 thiamine pyrophosphate transporter 19
MYVIYGSVQFSSYSFYNKEFSAFQEKFDINVSPSTHSFLLGSSAGCTSTFVSYPFDLLRTRFVQESHKFRKIPSTIKEILQEEGGLAMFKGLQPAIVSISLYTGLLFWCYERSKTISSNIGLNSKFVDPACGLISGTFAKTVVFPLDVIRKRSQVNKFKNPNFLRTGANIVKVESIRGLYKGFLVSLIKNAPTSAISLWTYQSFLRLYLK